MLFVELFVVFQHLFRSVSEPILTYPPLGFCNQQILGSKHVPEGVCNFELGCLDNHHENVYLNRLPFCLSKIDLPVRLLV